MLQGRVGGPLVSPRTSGRLGISLWRATLRHCPNRTARLFLRRTTYVEVAWRWGRVRGARNLPSSCDPRGAEPSCPWCTGLSALVPSPAWHGLPVRQKGDGGAVHASSWVGRRSGEDVSGLVKKEWPSGKEWKIDEKKHAGPLPGAPTVGVFPTGGHTNE